MADLDRPCQYWLDLAAEHGVPLLDDCPAHLWFVDNAAQPLGTALGVMPAAVVVTAAVTLLGPLCAFLDAPARQAVAEALEAHAQSAGMRRWAWRQAIVH